jgi:undecaprenyl pyrophosphate phosphatase UppP
MEFIEILKVVLLGIIEGITEWLPVSSTGHMILVEELLSLRLSEDFMEMFRVVVQLGAVLAVVVLYFHKLFPFSPKKSPAERKSCFRLWGMILIACVPAAVIGILLDDWLDAHLYNYITVAVTLIVYGIAFIRIEKRNKNRRASIERDRPKGIGIESCGSHLLRIVRQRREIAAHHFSVRVFDIAPFCRLKRCILVKRTTTRSISRSHLIAPSSEDLL